MFGFTSLPYEVIANIIARIEFDDAVHLGQTCKSLEFLLTEESICKSVVLATIPFSQEVQEASVLSSPTGYSRALRRYAKRRHALRTAQPFTIATVAFCDAYIYCKGILCYTVDEQIRLLDLHRSSKHEIVINIPDLLSKALLRADEHSQGNFEVLYCADYIVSCLYTSSAVDSRSWLISINSRFNRIIFVKELDSSEKIFARHNKQYVYYGTHSEIGADGYRRWAVHGFDIKMCCWFEEKIILSDLVGSDINSTICFEFHDQYFYALANQTSFEIEEIDWSSFYYCLRFPLASPCKELVETKKNSSDTWRRQHQEGPIDDRWSNLSLVADLSTNNLCILEARKEWHLGASRSQRTFYTTPINFPRTQILDGCNGDTDSDTAMAPNHNFNASSAFIGEDGIYMSSSVGKLHPSNRYDLSLLPETPLKQLLRESDNPLYISPPTRRPQYVHRGNDGSTSQTFTLAKSRVRTYHNSCTTFMDLVDHPVPTDWQQKQRLRLRVGGRSLGPPLRKENGLLVTEYELDDLDLDTALQTMYREEDIRFFPDYEHSAYTAQGLEAITTLLNPATHLGDVQGISDEYGMVYATGGGGGQPKALIWLGFDPGVKLEGLQWLPEKGCDTKIPSGASDDEKNTTVVVDRKGKGKAANFNARNGVQVNIGGDRWDTESESFDDTTEEDRHRNWAYKETAMYRDIGLGYYLGKRQKSRPVC